MNYRYHKIRGPHRQEPLKNVPPGYWSEQEAWMRDVWMRTSRVPLDAAARIAAEDPHVVHPQRSIKGFKMIRGWTIPAAAVLVVGALWWGHRLYDAREVSCATFECQLPLWTADAHADEVVLQDILHDASLSDELIIESL
jgi:hypothetical protein